MKGIEISTHVGFIGDLHIGSRNGQTDIRKWIKDYLLSYALPFFKEQNITDIIQVGDYYDIRRSLIGEDMWWLVDEFIPLLDEYGMTWHQISGNHTSIRKEELTVTWDAWLERESIAHGSHCVKCYDYPQDLKIGDTLFAISPWINKTNVDETIEYLKNTEASVCVGHFELANFLMNSSLATHGTLEEKHLEKFDVTLSGHYHIESYRNKIKYLGTPYALDWGSELDHTKRGLYTMDTLSQKLEFTPNPEGMSIFKVIEYDYEDISSKKLTKQYLDKDWLNDTLGLRGSVVKIEVTDRSSSKHYKDFLSVMRLVSTINYNTLDLTKEVITEDQEVTADSFKLDPIGILLKKIDSVGGEGFRHEEVSDKLLKVNTMCLERNNLI